MYTEDEARKKWCPWARELVVVEYRDGDPPIGATSANREEDGIPRCYCIASQCMAWRWAEEMRRSFKIHTDSDGITVPGDEDMPEPPRPQSVPVSWEWEPCNGDCLCGWLEPADEAQARRHGFCGIAGKGE